MDKKNLQLSVVFAAVYFFSLNGLGALPNLSLNFILKDQLKLSPAQLAYFQAVTLIAWVVKPLWGFISDSFPVMGYKRKSYLLLASGIAAACWLVLGTFKVLTLGNILLVISICYLAYAFQDVATDGLMIDTGKPLNLTGQFQSVQWCAVYLGMILTSLGGGYLSELAGRGAFPYSRIFLLTALFPLATLFLSAFFVREQKQLGAAPAVLKVEKVFLKKEIWILAIFLFLWNFSPSIGAPFFYYSVDTLKFTASFLGILQAVTSFGALLGSLLFGKYFAGLPVRKFLVYVVFAGIAAILVNYIYFVPAFIRQTAFLKGFSLLWNFLLGILNAVVFLQLLNLAAKVSPEGAGATVFALLMSFYNLGLMGSSALGGFLFPFVGLKALILVSAAFSLLVLPLMPLLPVNEKLTGVERLFARWLKLAAPGNDI